MSTSTGGTAPPSSFVTSPRWAIFGKCRRVMDTRAFSISLAHRGTIPFRHAAKGNTPMPSNRLPNVIVLLVVSPPSSVRTKDAARDTARLEQHETQKHRVAHSPPNCADGVATGGDALDEHGIDRHAHQDEQPLESHGE